MTRNAPLCLSIIFAGLATLSDCQEPQKGPAEKRTVEVRVDPRVELVSIVFRLAGNPEYSQGRVKSYLKDIDTHFQPVRQHEAIRCAAGLRAKYGVSFDACMSIAVHMRTGQGWGPRFPLDPLPDGLDGRWREKSAKTFLADLGEFVKESRFDRFLEEHRELYETTAKRMETLLGEEAHLEWFDQFFDRFAEKFVAEQGAAAASRPKVVSMTPNSGDQEVDPALSRIRVEFDRPMRDKSWSMCGWGESLPETTGQISYDESRRVWTAAVRLKADHEYRFSLNSPMFHGFKSADGVPLEPVEVHFKTKGPSPAQNR